MQVTISSVLRGAYTEKRGPELEIHAENPGTVVLKIVGSDRTHSEFVEVSIATLLKTLEAVSIHSNHENSAYEKAYQGFMRDATEAALGWKEKPKKETHNPPSPGDSEETV